MRTISSVWSACGPNSQRTSTEAVWTGWITVLASSVTTYQYHLYQWNLAGHKSGEQIWCYHRIFIGKRELRSIWIMLNCPWGNIQGIIKCALCIVLPSATGCLCISAYLTNCFFFSRARRPHSKVLLTVLWVPKQRGNGVLLYPS